MKILFNKFDYESYNEDLEKAVELISSIQEKSFKSISSEKTLYLSEAIDFLLKAELEDYEMEGE